jgi:hypothetical protein
MFWTFTYNVPLPDVVKLLVLLVAVVSPSVLLEIDPDVSTARDASVDMGSPAYTSASHVAFLTTLNARSLEMRLLSYIAGQSKVII